MPEQATIVWFRKDLRLTDNPALTEALSQNNNIILLYIHDAHANHSWAPGAASRWWLHHSLLSLQSSLKRIGAKLIIRQGDIYQQLMAAANECHAKAVYCNRVYEPYYDALDNKIKLELNEQNIQWRAFNSSLLFTPDTLMTQAGLPFRVFTPFWNKSQQMLFKKKPLLAPQKIQRAQHNLSSFSINELNLISNNNWHNKFNQYWQPGEIQAITALDRFCASTIEAYETNRDIPAVDGTSKLSAYLQFGEISPKLIIWHLENINAEIRNSGAITTFTKELFWREFAYYILHHFPHITDHPMDSRYDKFPYTNNPEIVLQTWQTGSTGFPLIDAGMRQLWQTGWMHNRVRMVVASFLTKNCLVSWKHGARWFWETLVDADVASNSFNWQWCAGCGVDAAPYFRIFNPIIQSQKFDPQGHYIKQWIPELNQLPERYIHEPWSTPIEVQKESGVHIGKDYPIPMLDIKQSRQRALDLYSTHIKTAPRK